LNNVIPASSPAPQRARLVIPAGRRTNRPFAIQPVAKRTIQTTRPTHAFAEDTNSRRVSQLSEALNESDASHELFVPFSACQLRCAVRGSQPPDDPASALLSGLATRASASSLASVALAVFRRDGCDAAVLDGGHAGCACRDGLPSPGRDDSPFATQVGLSPVIRAGVDRRNRFVSRSRTTRHIKRYRFDQIVIPRGPLSSNVVLTRPTILFIRCPSRVMHRRVPWRGVPLPDGPSLRSLAEASWSFPRNLAQRRSWGSLLFAGLLPPAGDRPSLVDRAHLPFSFSLRPIDFRRADFTALSREQ